MDLVHRYRANDAVRLGGLISRLSRVRRGLHELLRFACLAGLAVVVACTDDRSPEPRASRDGPPQRIVTLAPHLAELVFELGAGERLVGTVARSDYPAAARDVPRIGDAFRIDQERLAELAPDLVLVWPGGNPAELLSDLYSRGLPVVEFEIGRLADVAVVLRELGETLGEPARGARLAAAFEQGIDELRAEYSAAEPLRVFHQVSAQPLFTVGAEQSITDVITLCGGVNIFADLGTLAATVSHEAVVARAPQVILSTELPDAGAFTTWRRFPSLPAVANGELHFVDADLLSRPGPRLLAGARQICALLAAAR